MKKQFPALIALSALLIALTAVFTLVVRVPMPANQGYLNLSDVAITFASLIFGPWVGLVAGGVGTAIADLVGGYPQWAPISLVAHGLEGLVIGMIGHRRRSIPMMLLAWLPGAVVMVLGYLFGGALLEGWPAALVGVPINIGQGVIGAVIGIPLVLALRKAYPLIDQIGQRRPWTE